MDDQLTFLFMDYETFNSNPKGGRVSQYASIRTNYALEIQKDSAKNYFCLQSKDNIPSPSAALITKLTPQKIERIKNGIEPLPASTFNVIPEVYNEYWFISHIEYDMSLPKTCTLGYNSFKFDDEFTRNLLYRNLRDPYEREWSNNNSRFDVYFLVLATYVLKPEILNFPQARDKENNELLYHSKTNLPLPSFRLEDLSIANKISHTNAHDAFSDVEATIEIMKIIKNADEYFFEEIFSLRKKKNVNDWLNKNNNKPFIHISQYYGKENYSMGILYQIANNHRAYLCLNLSHDVQPLIDLEGEDLENYLFPKETFEYKKNVVIIYNNQCPILANVSEYAERLKSFNLDREKMSKNLNLIRENINPLSAKLKPLYFKDFPLSTDKIDSDLKIYSGGFFSDLERDSISQFHCAITMNNNSFSIQNMASPRLKEMALKIIARNFPDKLTEEEKKWWFNYSRNRISNKEIGSEYTIDDCTNEISELFKKQLKIDEMFILAELREYVNSLKRYYQLTS
ncbi:MAG: exodeoxyribonuclease I [Bacteroidetes bacterium]|nr:exodeoxyribonuclease I [Bacteroidota bacterium]